MWLAVVATFFSMIFIAQASLAQSTTRKEKIEALQKRLNNLEKQQQQMDDWYNKLYIQGNSQINPFMREKISLGGYFESTVYNFRGPDMDTQTNSYNEALGLNLAAEFTEKLKFTFQTLSAVGISAVNLHNNPNLTPPKRQFRGLAFGTILAQGYLEYKGSDIFNVQSGIGYIPFGIAYQQREPFLFHKRSGPQILINEDGSGIGIASALWMGLHVYGQLSLDGSRVGYNLYTLTPASKVTTLGVGGRLWWMVNENIKTGVSFQSAKRQQGSYLSKGVDLDVNYKNFGLLSEYAVRDDANQSLDPETYYFEPYYKFNDGHWLAYVNIEYIKMPLRVDAATQKPDPIEKRFYGAGVNWLPMPAIRLRLGFLKHDYINETDTINGQKRDYTQTEFSTAVAF
ncbi:hypothetical protein CIK05_01420 [Bdellovibrio sp. qaytius]|nr:hypothetical protein CIK05_01420 [Bdellovibrio sp. qaytius]